MAKSKPLKKGTLCCSFCGNPRSNERRLFTSPPADVRLSVSPRLNAEPDSERTVRTNPAICSQCNENIGEIEAARIIKGTDNPADGVDLKKAFRTAKSILKAAKIPLSVLNGEAAGQEIVSEQYEAALKELMENGTRPQVAKQLLRSPNPEPGSGSN